MCDASHRGLYDFGIVHVGSVGRAVDGVDAKPVGNADDGSHISGVLYAVDGEGEGCGKWQTVCRFRYVEDCQHLLRVLQETDAPQFLFRNLLTVGPR